MAVGLSALALGSLAMNVGGKVIGALRNRKKKDQAPAPAPTPPDSLVTGAAPTVPQPPDATLAASNAVVSARTAAKKTRKRATSTRPPNPISLLGGRPMPTTPPRSLIGYR